MVRVGVKKVALGEVEGDLLAVGLFAGEEPPLNLAAAAGPAITNEDFAGKRGQTSLLYAGDDLEARRLLLVGLGDRTSYTAEIVMHARVCGVSSGLVSSGGTCSSSRSPEPVTVTVNSTTGHCSGSRYSVVW